MSDNGTATRAVPDEQLMRALRHAADPQASAVTEQPWQSELRRAVVDRVRVGSIRLARNVWERRHSDPISHHALALLYVQQEVDKVYAQIDGPSAPPPTRLAVTAAWRTWLAGPETDNLARLLFRLHHHLAPQAATPGFDLLTDWLEFRKDDTMRPDAVYVGIAVVSLDTPDRPWRRAQLVTENADDIASYGRIVTTDGTIIAFHREGYNQMNQFRAWSTHNLSYSNGHPPFRWSRATAGALIPDADNADDPFTWLTTLGDTCAQADNQRVVHNRAGEQR